MPRKVRLLEAYFHNGHLHKAGETVDLADGEKGPHRAVRKSADRVDYGTSPPIDANRILGEFEDIPLYQEVRDMTVATQTIVERKGDDAKDRQANLGHHPPETAVEAQSKPSVTTEPFKRPRDPFPT